MPEAFSEGKIDWEKLKATLGENTNFSNERYVLNWAGKSDAFKVLQAPSTKTLIPAKDESVDFDKTENIFIEGENMEVLKVLQKSYFGKIKMIYIDPPYNTGNDSFIYPDKFSESKADYEKRVGDKDEEGYMTKDGMFKKNSKENGQYHSNWLNMMMPRLYLAKNLLRQDGVMFVSIDDHEVHNLTQMMNEIFGEENFIGLFCRKTKSGGGSASNSCAVEHDYVLSYARNNADTLPLIEEFTEKYLRRYKETDEIGPYFWDTMERSSTATKPYKIKAPDGEMLTGKWFRSETTFLDDLEKGEVKFLKKDEGWSVQFKQRLTDGKKLRTILEEANLTDKKFRSLNKELEDIIGFSIGHPPKPISLMKKLIYSTSNRKENEIILDFFAGSGSTLHGVLELNKKDFLKRKCISVQLPELCDEDSDAFKAGFKTVADVAKERIRKAGKNIQKEIESEIKKHESKIKKLQGELPTEETKAEIENLQTKIEQLKIQDLGFKVFKLEDSNFKQWQQIEGKDAKALAEQMKLFVDPVSETATVENMVYELLLKSGKHLNSIIDKKENFYAANNNELILVLEKATQEIIDEIIASKPNKVIALDKLFKGNDQLKTNTVLQMKDAGIEFKTI